MISANVLKKPDMDVPGYRIRGMGDIESRQFLDALKQKITEVNDASYGFPIMIADDKVKYGGMFNSTTEDCIVITNTEHETDYFWYVITAKKQAQVMVSEMFYYGQSKLTGRANATEQRKQSGTLRGLLMNAAFGVNENDLNAEYDYYQTLHEIYNSILG